MTRYSKPAIEFQAATKIGNKFLLRERVAKMLRMGQHLKITAVLKETTDPDNYLYKVTDSDNREYKVRSWWLRRCCERVDGHSPPSG